MPCSEALQKQRRKYSRRSFLRKAGSLACAAASGPAIIIPGRAQGRRKTLKILQWNHFVPAYDHWFSNVYIKEWGEKNDTEVIVERVGMTSLNSRAEAEIKAQQGHDLFMFVSPPAIYEDHVIDHSEIYQECERRYGQPVDFARKSTYNLKTKKYYGFFDSYVPDPVNYRQDLWSDVGVVPDSWDNIRLGGQKIMQKHAIPVGIGLSPELDSNMALRSIAAAFGATVQDQNNRPILNSAEMLEAVKFVKALYQDTMTDAVFTWDPSSNNRLMLAGKGSLTLNAISVTRTGEKQRIPLTDRIWLAEAARGPVNQLGFMHLMNIYVVWKFAKNIEGAKQFLIDYPASFRQAFLASSFYNFPCFPQTVPDLNELISHDDSASPADKYAIFKNVADWTVTVGYPGYANAAIDEVFSQWIIPNMFAQAAKGLLSPTDAINAADKTVQAIFAKWRAAGKV